MIHAMRRTNGPKRRARLVAVLAAMLVFLSLFSGNATAAGWGRADVAHTSTISVEETAGVAREDALVEVTLRVRQKAQVDPRSPQISLIAGERRTPVPVQVLGVEKGDRVTGYQDGPLIFVHVAFLADVPANGKARYAVDFDAGAPPKPDKPMVMTTQEEGPLFDSGTVEFRTDPLSGQLNGFRPKLEGVEDVLFFRQGRLQPIHWNPDVYRPPAAWGHTSDWRTPLAYDPEKHDPTAAPPIEGEHPYFHRQYTGPVLNRTVRWGPMPRVPDMRTGVSYSFIAGKPYLLGSSWMDFNDGMQVSAVRIGELVFSRGQFDHVLWLEGETPRIAECYDYDEPTKYYDVIRTLPPRTDCTALVNEEKGFGIAYLTLGLTGINRFSGYDNSEQTNYYFLDYSQHSNHDLNFLYMCRPLVFRRNYAPTYVQRGAQFAAEFAMVVFALRDGADRYGELLEIRRKLTNPLVVVAD